MKVGVLVESEEGLDWDSWRGTCIAAERLGFESVWISDHLQSPWAAERHGLEPWLALGVAAAETQRLVLGTLVSPITFREPVVMARMAEALDRLSDGRFVIGLGLGWNAEEHAHAGIAFPPVMERSRRLVEVIERIRLELGPRRRVPILIGGKGARSTLPVVARYADEWNMTTSSVADYRRCTARLDCLCEEIGRIPDEIRRSVALGYLVGRDAVELGERCTRMRRVVQPLAEVADPDVVEAARRMGWVVGTPEQMVASLRPLAEAGVDRIVLGHYDLEQMSALELIAEAVIPQLE
jgi:alkanesulfonate monooxygenase SsuD/methylene tetrahydromethanopterin reductase-like flavin-dependent oxidoreductase (luciferase family)